MVADSHCHLNLFDSASVDEVALEASKAGLDAVITVCTHLGECAELSAIAERHSLVYMSVGVHPHQVSGDLKSEVLVRHFNDCSKVVALGETGLDYHYPGFDALKQKGDFRAHIAASLDLGVPVIMHNRDSDADMSDFLEIESRNQRFEGVMHSFASSMDLCKVALDCGLYISFSGILTFKNAKLIQDVAKYVPSDRILVETDAPYLAPEPFRGERNFPKHVLCVMDFLKEIRSDDTLEEVVENNFYRLFKGCVKD